MAAIDWDSSGKRFYNAGLDRSVLYTFGNPGVPWFGLYSIEEKQAGGEPEPYYLDGYKYLNLASNEEFEATLNALQYPEEFESCNGVSYLAQGLMATQQERQPFGLCYRTLIGSDTKVLGSDYKLHIIYRALARPTDVTHTTLHDETSMEIYSWDITTLPYRYAGSKPISHMVIDSRLVEPSIMNTLETYLYGTHEQDPFLPDPGQLVSVLSGELLDLS